MSDDDKDVDIESDDEDLGSSASISGDSNRNSTFSQADKRAHHNALERKRRDHIKDSFSSLRDSVPSLHGEKSVSQIKASRAQILKKAAEYIAFMRRKNTTVQADIDDLKRQNKVLEEQIVRTLEKAKSASINDFNGTSLLDPSSHTKIKSESVSSFDGVSDSDSISDGDGILNGNVSTGSSNGSIGIGINSMAQQKRSLQKNKKLKTSSESSESSTAVLATGVAASVPS
jgi:Max protein